MNFSVGPSIKANASEIKQKISYRSKSKVYVSPKFAKMNVINKMINLFSNSKLLFNCISNDVKKENYATITNNPNFYSVTIINCSKRN